MKIDQHKKTHYRFLANATFLAVGIFAGSAAQATEGGGSIYPNGVDNFAAGAMPPPGLCGMVFTQHYTAGQLKDKR